MVQNQLLLSEEKISNINQKTTTADQKWEARVKEYETRLKAGEEKYKRERQGAKERVLELENQMRFVFMLFPPSPPLLSFFLLGCPRSCVDNLAWQESGTPERTRSKTECATG